MNSVQQDMEACDFRNHATTKTQLQIEQATTQTPPTLIPTNKFTNVFQNLVNSYGTINAIIGLLMIIFEKKLS